ncbi:MAG: hypothetical protein ACLPX8_26980 [Bryobacteraceae bacterium]|jgi:uncharacterized protein (TIGR03437 family)
MRFVCGMLALGTLFAAWSQPSITSGGVVNNASYFGKGTVGSGIAQGSLFAIFGQGFGPSGVVPTATSFPVETTLAGVSVDIHSGGAVLSALPLYVATGQIGAILPSATPLGSATVVVNYNGSSSQPEPVTVVTRNFGVFSVNQAGTGPAAAQNAAADGTLSLNSPVNSVQPGQTVVLWGTGAGPVSGNEAAGPLPGNLSGFNLTVYVGGIPAIVRYVGRSGCCAGVDQINIVVPSASITGCYVPVVVTGPALAGTAQNTQIPADHAVGNFTTLSISANGGACTDASGLNAAQLARFEAGIDMTFGALAFERAPQRLTPATIDSVSGGFGGYSPAAFFRSQGIFGLPAPGTCVSSPMPLSQTAPVDPALNYSLQAGTTLTINGPNGNGMRQATRNADGSYDTGLGSASGTPAPPFLSPGPFTVSNGSGGGDVGSFTALFNMPAPLAWTNSTANFQGVTSPTLTWTGGTSGTLAVIASVSYNDDAGFFALCTVDSTTGSFTIPLYAYQGNILLTSAAPGLLSLGTGALSSFSNGALNAGFIWALAMNTGVYVQ